MADVLDRELKAFENNKAHLEREHAGKFVLIHGDELIGTFDAFEAAAEEGLRRFGYEPFLVRRIGVPDPNLSVAVAYGLTDANP